MTNTSVITNRDRDCLACRLISGSGLIGAGLYITHHSKKFNKIPGKFIMSAIASGFILLGACRLFNLPPFREKFSH